MQKMGYNEVTLPVISLFALDTINPAKLVLHDAIITGIILTMT